jgi:uncharacterized protein (TIGR02001 family)
MFALAVATIAVPAFAEDAPAAPASAFTITGGATLTSDYRFRGVSQTNRRFALQGTIGVSHESGFYIGTWGSSIDDYVAAGGDQEIDLYGGYKHTFSGTTVDGGLLYYYYPGSHGATTDFFEPYLNASHTFGPVGVKVGMNYAWKQHGQRCDYDPRCTGTREDNLYTYGELSAAIPNTGFTVTGHLGESFGRSYLTNGLKNYTDWSLTAAYTWKALTFSAAYVDTDIKNSEFVTGTGRSPVKGGFVGAVAVAF